MEGWSFPLYIIVHISICGRAQKGGSLHVKDKIIQNSVFQPGSGPRNVVGADEEGDGRVPRLVVVSWANDGAQIEFVWPNCGPIMDKTSGGRP